MGSALAAAPGFGGRSAEVPVAHHHLDLAHLAGLVVVHGREVFRAEALLESELNGLFRAGFAGGAQQAFDAGNIGAGGLLTIDVLARRDCGFEMLGMQVDGRGDQDRVHVGLRQEFVVILIDARALRSGDFGLRVVDAVRVDVADGGDLRTLDIGHVGADINAAPPGSDYAV